MKKKKMHKKEVTPKHIYFVRHGQSDANIDRIYRGKDAHLTEVGIAQAKEVARRFKSIPVDLIVASTFPRAKDTAQYIHEATRVPIEESPFFIERERPSEAIGLHDKSEEMNELDDRDIKYLFEGGRHSDEETFADMKKRADKGIDFLKNRLEENIAVVSHAFFLKFLLLYMCYGDLMTPELFIHTNTSFHISNTGITHVKMREDQTFQIRQWNDSAHLGEVHKGVTRRRG